MAMTSAPAFTGVGPYQVIRYLGHGPVAAAYLCHKVDAPDGLYVMSIVHDDLSIYRWLIEQLLAEVADCARVQHPNVESILEFGTVEQHGYVVTRHVEGCALSRLLLLAGGDIPLRICLPLLVDVLRGLHAAHSVKDARDRPIVHSGIVPACILIGVDGIARVAEFGLARVQMRTTQTMPGVRIDRFAHLAPEQIRQSAEIDLRADIFAAGTILWQLATGESLFGVGDSVATMHRVLHHPPPGPSSTGRHPPAWLDPICLRALQKDPAQRYASAEEMANELQSRAVANKYWAPRPEIVDWVENALVNADSILPPQLPPRAPSGLSFHRLGGSDGLRITGTGPKPVDTAPPANRKAPVIIAIAVMAALALGVLALIIGNRHLTLRFATEPQITSSVVLSPPPPSPVGTEPKAPAHESKVVESNAVEPAPGTAPAEVAREPRAPVSSSAGEGPAATAIAVRPPAPQVRAKPAPPSVPKPSPPPTPSVSASTASPAPSVNVPAAPPAGAPSKPFFPPVENNPYLRHSH